MCEDNKDIIKDFLIEEYKELNNSLHINEETGDKRLEFFITLASIVIGAIGFIMKDYKGTDETDMFHQSFYFIIILWLIGLIIIGLIIFRRLKKRNDTTDGFKDDIRRIRGIIKNTFDKNHDILPENYTAFEKSDDSNKRIKKPERVFTSIHDIAKIIICVLIGTLTAFVFLIFKSPICLLIIFSALSFLGALILLLGLKKY
jgi:hypothetical protein